MALLRVKKNEIVDELSDFIVSSKMTVIAKYEGTPVKALQKLRKDARNSNTTIKVIKNRLVIKALQNNPKFKDIDTDFLNGMLLYVFNNDDEVAGAQAIAKFAKTQPTLEIIGAISNNGEFINKVDANTIAALPTKEQLRGQLVGTLAAPLTGFVGVLSGNIRSLFNVLNARADNIS
jgi:large subunit ribosomal protein L10